MNISHIEHIGIAVESLEQAIPFYENILGFSCYAIEEVPDQKVRTAFFQVGQTKIELLESTDPEGPVGKFIAKKGPGVHHIAFLVETYFLRKCICLVRARSCRLRGIAAKFASVAHHLGVKQKHALRL